MSLLKVHEELKNGGTWLGTARRWMQSNIRNGDSIVWSSEQLVSVRFCDLEKFALKVATSAVNADRENRK